MELTKAQLKEMRLRPCLACGKSPCDIAHIKTKATGGMMDEFSVISLCRFCHSDSHRMGWKGFFALHPQVESHILSLGWEVDQTHGRFRLIRSQ